MKADLYNIENKKVGVIELPEKIFSAKWNPALVHQVFVAQLGNKRKVLAHTKGRGEVRGGGRKPWKQKHTGRARVGSIRSPIWSGGGTTHGPNKERNFEKKVNKKMKVMALFSILSKKLKDNQLRFIDDLNLNDHKTKLLVKVLRNFFEKPTSTLLMPDKKNKRIFLAGRNIPKTKVLDPESANVYDLLSHKNVLLEKDAVENIINHFNK